LYCRYKDLDPYKEQDPSMGLDPHKEQDPFMDLDPYNTGSR
jgi:hypothetical protein